MGAKAAKQSCFCHPSGATGPRQGSDRADIVGSIDTKAETGISLDTSSQLSRSQAGMISRCASLTDAATGFVADGSVEHRHDRPVGRRTARLAPPVLSACCRSFV
jgi:hypothetical protein